MARSCFRQRGLALVAVLWVVAALSVLVTGLLRSQRNEIQVVASARQAAQAGAMGQAAVQLALREIAGRSVQVQGVARLQVEYGGTPVSVEVMPLNGLININSAGPALLAALFQVAGELPPERAGALAQTVVAARQTALGRRGPRFEAAEDLLQVPGVDYRLYARLATLITADAGTSSGRVNPLAAPPGVLLVIAQGDAVKAARIAAVRSTGGTSIDTADLSPAFLDGGTTNRYRIAATVLLPDGRKLRTARVAEIGRTRADGIPWRIFHGEDQFEPAVSTVN